MKQRKYFYLRILVGALSVMLLSPNFALAQTNATSINNINNVASITVLIATILGGFSSLLLGLIKVRQIAHDVAGFEDLLQFILMPFINILILAIFNFVFDGQWNLGLTLSLVLNGAVFGNFFLIVCKI